MSFDFDIEILKQLKGKIPDKSMDILIKREEGHRHCVQFPDGVYRVDVDCRVGEDLQENKEEIFLPFIINRIM